jgi:opacity protein-like surface antigen
MRIQFVLPLLFLATFVPIFAQGVPTATDGESPFSAGGGLSTFNTGIDDGHMYGGALWADYRLNKAPSYSQGVGLEVEARDLLLGRSSKQPSYLAEKTIGGGVTYTWRHFQNFHPYAKALLEFGTGAGPTMSRTVTALGGGLDYRLFGKVWLRADYEYQAWPDFYKHSNGTSGSLNPDGFTIGFTYHFGRKNSGQPSH